MILKVVGDVLDGKNSRALEALETPKIWTAAPPNIHLSLLVLYFCFHGKLIPTETLAAYSLESTALLQERLKNEISSNEASSGTAHFVSEAGNLLTSTISD
jgi:hypothetical protein